jgi:predicted transcriptional regulator
VKSGLILPCEVAARSVVPAIKASIAVQLIESFSMKQKDVADLLGLSQSAVSKYSTGTRGYILKIGEVEEVKPIIAEMVAMLASGKPRRAEILEKFCQTCMIIRRKGLMCQFCEKADSTVRVEKCNFCFVGKR